MKKIIILFILNCLAKILPAQYVYTIKADSVKITNCDSSELIIENHTQNIPGFLFNTGNGRTVFKRGSQKINDSLYLIGADSLKLRSSWWQGGNSFGATGVLGTLDNNHLDFYTNNQFSGRWTNSGNLLIGTKVDSGYRLQVSGNGMLYGPVNVGATLYIGDTKINKALGIHAYGDTAGTVSHYGGIGLNILEAGSLYNTGKQGGGVYFDDRNNVQPIRFMVKSVGSFYDSAVGSFTSTGNLLIGTTVDNGYKLDVNGSARIYAPNVNSAFTVNGGDAYIIRAIPNYDNIYGSSIAGSMITFGNIVASIGVNKQILGNIPANSLIIGGTGPGKVTTLVDNGKNPAFSVDGNGSVTINGGYNSVLAGVGQVPNSNSWDFNINGGRGTGSGIAGDIIFSTGSSQVSSAIVHPMTNRWWLKGGTGYLSNSATPSSALDITGANGFSQLRLRTPYTPTSTADTNGNTGDFSWDSNYLYIKTSGGWKRAALTTF